MSSRFYVYRLVSEGVIPRRSSKNARSALDRDDVERVALDHYRPGHPYWLITPEVAELLGVTPTRVRQLVTRGFVPAIEHHGRRYYRRHQIEVIANARDARKVTGTLGQ